MSSKHESAASRIDVYRQRELRHRRDAESMKQMLADQRKQAQELVSILRRTLGVVLDALSLHTMVRKSVKSKPTETCNTCKTKYPCHTVQTLVTVVDDTESQLSALFALRNGTLPVKGRSVPVPESIPGL